MIPLQHHITHDRAGNVTAFAKAMAVSRPTVYRWLRDGAIWHNGRVYDPVTPAPAGTENVLDVITDMNNRNSPNLDPNWPEQNTAQKMVRVFAEKLPAKDVLKSHRERIEKRHAIAFAESLGGTGEDLSILFDQYWEQTDET